MLLFLNLVHNLLAANRHHVAASYWTAASDVAATSAPVIAEPPDHQSTMVDHRSTATDHGGDRRSTVVVNDGRRWRTTVDCRWTTVDHHRSTVVGRLVNVGHEPGLDRFWIGSGLGRPCGMPRVRQVCPRGIHVDADVDNVQHVGVEPGASRLESLGKPKRPTALGSGLVIIIHYLLFNPYFDSC
nr:hypothetical protein [Tanacetum cinerariifolium]